MWFFSEILWHFVMHMQCSTRSHANRWRTKRTSKTHDQTYSWYSQCMNCWKGLILAFVCSLLLQRKAPRHQLEKQQLFHQVRLQTTSRAEQKGSSISDIIKFEPSAMLTSSLVFIPSVIKLSRSLRLFKLFFSLLRSNRGNHCSTRWRNNSCSTR